MLPLLRHIAAPAAPGAPVALAALVVAVFVLSAPAAHAQAGGFSDGDLFLSSGGITGVTYADGGLLAIDPLSGHTEQWLDFGHSALLTGAAAFDPYRKRLLVSAEIDDPTTQFALWMVDGVGQLEKAVHTLKAWGGLSPTGDGRVYFLDPYDTSGPFQYLDAANRRHDLLDADTGLPFSVSGIFNHNQSAMTYDAATNALFVAHTGNKGPSCTGGSAYGITLHKLPLSADGSRVVGPVPCTEFQVDAVQSTETPVNWSRGPGGALVLVCDNLNLTEAMPRIVLVDPVSLVVTPFAQTGPYPGAAQSTAGAYSSLLGEVLVLDTLGNVLRSFGPGDSGAGTVVVPDGPLSADPGSGEMGTMLEIDNGPCSGAFVPLGQGLAGAGNVVPALIATGCAALGSQAAVLVADVVGGAPGFLLVGVTAGEQAFRGGTLFMESAELAVPLQVGGSPGVAGAGAVEVPFGTLSDPALAGITLLLQAGFLDAGAVQGASLSQGLRVEFD